LLWFTTLATITSAQATVRHKEGIVHGFLVLRALDGKAIADGDWTQDAHGDRVKCVMEFRFRDGSLHRETTVFTQTRDFRVLSNHLEQTGPSFPHPLEMTVQSSGETTVKYKDDGGKDKVATEHFHLPSDFANGLVTILLQNISVGSQKTTFSMVVATPKPRLVKLSISPEGEEPFTVGTVNRKAIRYAGKMELGGAAGVIAPLVGKEPPDMHFWVLGGDAPVCLKSEIQLYAEGPIWRVELTIPTWSDTAVTATPSK
jgi:hypothetical protein